MSRPYAPEDLLSKNKTQLLAIIDADLDKWPYKQKDGKTVKLNKSKVRVDELRNVLLDPTNGFSTNLPRLTPSNAPRPNVTPTRTPQPGGAAAILQSRTVGQPTSKPDRKLRVYLHDRRFGKIQRNARSIEVAPADFVDCNIGEWRVHVKDVIERLQVPPVAITGTGSVRLGVPDDMDSEFTEWFIEGDISCLNAVTPNPELLKISAKSILNLSITEGATTGKRRAEPQDGHLEDQDGDGTPITKRRRVVSNEHSTQHRTLHINQLSALLHRRPGYDDFSKSRRRCVSNPDIVSHWAFAAQFYSAYFHQLTEAIDECKGCKITKIMLCRALDMEESTMDVMRHGHRLVGVFGRNGTHPCQEVINVLEAQAEPPAGSTVLYKFLRKWEKDHGLDVV
ncbi:hypothetical protein ONZ45_g13776 [Pleurotus djamor]|nr:hypothetical protein ONZ45_g13776 [Pleurotus djamor]